MVILQGKRMKYKYIVNVSYCSWFPIILFIALCPFIQSETKWYSANSEKRSQHLYIKICKQWVIGAFDSVCWFTKWLTDSSLSIYIITGTWHQNWVVSDSSRWQTCLWLPWMTLTIDTYTPWIIGWLKYSIVAAVFIFFLQIEMTCEVKIQKPGCLTCDPGTLD